MLQSCEKPTPVTTTPINIIINSNIQTGWFNFSNITFYSIRASNSSYTKPFTSSCPLTGTNIRNRAGKTKFC